MTITRGDTLNLKINYLTKEREPIEISSNEVIKFTVKNKIDGLQIFQKVITIENYDSTNKCYNMTIEPSDTASVSLNGKDRVDYYYDFEFSNSQTGLVKTLDKGKFSIKYDITTPVQGG